MDLVTTLNVTNVCRLLETVGIRPCAAYASEKLSLAQKTTYFGLLSIWGKFQFFFFFRLMHLLYFNWSECVGAIYGIETGWGMVYVRDPHHEENENVYEYSNRVYKTIICFNYNINDPTRPQICTCHLQKCALFWSLYSTYEYNVFLQDFDNEPINFCKMDPRATAWFRLNTDSWDWGKLINLIMITYVCQNQPFGAWMGNCSIYMNTHGTLLLKLHICPLPNLNGLHRWRLGWINNHITLDDGCDNLSRFRVKVKPY